jgi:hypothetical protein
LIFITPAIDYAIIFAFAAFAIFAILRRFSLRRFSAIDFIFAFITIFDAFHCAG